MKKKIILKREGFVEECAFDKSLYSYDHDVPALWITDIIIALGNGYNDWGCKDPTHLRWKFKPDKKYRITIEEI